ncbi:hypothetical protein MKR81_24555 [Vibrio campbellii]|uniref:hypothetical protein n=1 Tax=Vibrio campbellii TaxID=680 RepID=UPI001F085A98|nr:hypothetical protein [Vibrio campbellii]UMM05352.1 hypothetical protein MKR81_24555 [Vibrio campbellii]
MKSLVYSPLSCGLFLILCLVYGSGFYLLAQSSVWLTFVLTLMLPVLFWPLTKPVENANEIKRILCLETGFNLLCFLAVSQWVSVEYVDKGLIVFFVLQSAGFIMVQIKKQAYLSALISMVLAAAIAYWIHIGAQTTLLGEGSILLFGEAVPWQLKLIYGFWLMQLLLVEYRSVLPKLTLAICHIASFVIAIGAEDFFHARIVTASHLLFLSLCFNLKSLDWGGGDFVVSTRFSRFIQLKMVREPLSEFLLGIVVMTYLGIFLI